MKGKLQKVQHGMKKAHGMQKKVRAQLEELDEAKEKGLDKETYNDKKAKLEARRHEIINQLKDLEEQDRALRGELEGLEAAA